MASFAYNFTENSSIVEIGHAFNMISQETSLLNDAIVRIETDAMNMKSILEAEIASMKVAMESKIAQLEAATAGSASGGGDKRKGEKSPTDRKGFDKIKEFDGSEKAFPDWEFKLHQFLSPCRGMEMFLNEIKDLEKDPGMEEVQDSFDTVLLQFPGAETHSFDEDLYQILSALTTGPPLQIVKNVKDCYGHRGSLAWYKLTRDVAGRTTSRLSKLASKVNAPTKITSYKTAEIHLNQWENDLQELEKMQKQIIPDFMKVTILKGMIPVELQKDIDLSRDLKKWEDIWNFVHQQVALRKDWTNAPARASNGSVPMDLSVAEEASEKAAAWTKEGEEQCSPCNEEELDTLKGSGKGYFAGNCNHCGKYGHRKSECRSLTASLKGGKEGKGEDKGKGKGKGEWTPVKGGGKGFGYGPSYGFKGKGKDKGKGKGSFYNIDGDNGEWWTTEWSTSGRIFLLENFEEDEEPEKKWEY